MTKFRLRRHNSDKVSEGAHIFRAGLGTAVVIFTIGFLFWKYGPSDAAPTPANQTTMTKAVVGK